MNPFKYKTEVNRLNFENELKRFGLSIDIDSVCKYVDTYPQNENEYKYRQPRVFTCTFKDSSGKGWANIYGNFYKNHTLKRTKLFREFKDFIDSHTFKIGNYYYF